MWYQFYLENAHFAVYIFAALVSFAVFWLYFDAWKERRIPSELIRIGGFLLLSVSYVAQAAQVETSIVASPFIASVFIEQFQVYARIGAFVLLIVSLLAEPLQPHPGRSGSTTRIGSLLLLPVVGAWVGGLPLLLSPILASVIGLLYLRRATVGLEDHVKPVAASFFLTAAAELIGMHVLFRTSPVVNVYELVAPFGIIWIVEHIMVLVATCILARWVFGYLLKQFHTQLFIIITTITIVIFLATTVTFTALLVRSVEQESLSLLATNVQVLSYTLESKKSESIADSQVIAQNAQIIDWVKTQNASELSDFAQQFLLTKKQHTVVITNDTSKVLARGEERDRVGDSLSDVPLVKRALLGETNASVVSQTGAISPQLSIQAAAPIRDGATIIGVALVGVAIDSAYVDGLKSATGLESTIYGDNQISATTLPTADGKERLVGIRMDQSDIKTTVLANGQPYQGSVVLANTPYFGAFLPLRDVDTNPVGMMFVGKPQTSVLAAAGRSIELTFLSVVVLMVLSVIPSARIAKYIADQL